MTAPVPAIGPAAAAHLARDLRRAGCPLAADDLAARIRRDPRRWEILAALLRAGGLVWPPAPTTTTTTRGGHPHDAC